jgi:hypothetical protein
VGEQHINVTAGWGTAPITAAYFTLELWVDFGQLRYDNGLYNSNNKLKNIKEEKKQIQT